MDLYEPGYLDCFVLFFNLFAYICHCLELLYRYIYISQNYESYPVFHCSRFMTRWCRLHRCPHPGRLGPPAEARPPSRPTPWWRSDSSFGCRDTQRSYWRRGKRLSVFSGSSSEWRTMATEVCSPVNFSSKWPPLKQIATEFILCQNDMKFRVIHLECCKYNLKLW